jgi:hypothetical protein
MSSGRRAIHWISPVVDLSYSGVAQLRNQPHPPNPLPAVRGGGRERGKPSRSQLPGWERRFIGSADKSCHLVYLINPTPQPLYPHPQRGPRAPLSPEGAPLPLIPRGGPPAPYPQRGPFLPRKAGRGSKRGKPFRSLSFPASGWERRFIGSADKSCHLGYYLIYSQLLTCLESIEGQSFFFPHRLTGQSHQNGGNF